MRGTSPSWRNSTRGSSESLCADVSIAIPNVEIIETMKNLDPEIAGA